MVGHSNATRLRKARRRKAFPVEPEYIYLKRLKALRGKKRSVLRHLYAEKHNDYRGRVPPIAWSSPYQTDCLILHAPLRDETLLAPTTEVALLRGIKQVVVVGSDRTGIEYQVDRIIIGDGSDPGRFMATTSHDNMREALRSCGRGCGVVRFCQLYI